RAGHGRIVLAELDPSGRDARADQRRASLVVDLPLDRGSADRLRNHLGRSEQGDDDRQQRELRLHELPLQAAPQRSSEDRRTAAATTSTTTTTPATPSVNSRASTDHPTPARRRR